MVVKDTTTSKPSKPSTVAKATETEVMIPWFADQTTLKFYQDKFTASGLTFEIIEVIYVDNSSKFPKEKSKSISGKNYISALHAKLYVGGVFYKEIIVKDFKEIRIRWETYPDGRVIIKSLNYLDHNFMSRKL